MIYESNIETKKYDKGGILALILGIVLICFGSTLLVRSVTLDEDVHKARLEILEQEMLQDMFNIHNGTHGTFVRVRSEWESFSLPVGLRSWAGVSSEVTVPFHSHYISAIDEELGRRSEKSKPQLLLLHGYGTSSALCWRNVLAGLAKHFDIVALDVPGFGRSNAPTFLPSMSSTEVVNMYCDYFDTFQERVGLKNPYVIAHSFGGFLFTHCASKYPRLASNVMLVDVPGFFPSNGGLDYMFAFWFSMGLPQSFLRSVLWGRYGEKTLQKLAKYMNLNWSRRMVSYWHELHMGADLISGQVVSTFVKFHYLYAIGENVALIPLMNLTMPINLLYGENDPIAPAHQGHFVSQLAHGLHVSNLFVVPNTGHVPFFAKTNGTFIEMAVDAYYSVTKGLPSKLAVDFQERDRLHLERGEGISTEGVSHSAPAPADMATCLSEKNLEWALHKCLPLIFLSERNQRSMYAAIVRIRNHCKGLVRGGELEL